MKQTLPYIVRFPDNPANLTVEEEYFYVQLEGREQKIRLHDYARIYPHPGLYEQVVTDKLQCRSPWVVAELLVDEIDKSGVELSSVKVLDFGAGCGIAGAILHARGVRSIVGLDMIAEAAEAAWRDHPDVYRTYVVGDICSLEPERWRRLEPHRFNTLICVSSLALGHVDPDAFVRAYNLISDGGWIAFNIRYEPADEHSDPNGDSFKQAVMRGDCMQVMVEHVYNHRKLMNGEWIANVAVIGRKRSNLSARRFSTCR